MEEKNTLSQAIVSDAQSYAEETVRLAKEYADKKAKETQFEIQTYILSQEELARKESLDIERKNAAQERMESKKIMLSAKVALVDEVYERTKSKLSSLEKGEQVKFFASLAEKYYAKGDEILVAKDAAFTAEDLEKTLEVKGVPVKSGDFTGGGLLLKGKTYDRDLSFDSIIQSAREKTETEISAKLFD